MSFLDIAGTPVQIGLDFLRVGDMPPASIHPLAGTTGTFLRAVLLAQLPASEQAALSSLLSTPLDQLFDTAWSNLQTSAQGFVQQAITSFKPNAHDINVTFPTQGTLRAQVGDLSPGLLAQMPWGVNGSQLTLSYLLPGIVVTFKLGGLIIDFLFDGEIGVYLGVPTDSTVPLVSVQEFLTHNAHYEAGDLVTKFIFDLQDILTWLNNQPIPDRNLADQYFVIPFTLQDLSNVSSTFLTAASFGFLKLGVQINQPLPGAAPGNTVEFDLTHHFDPGPVVSNALSSGGPSLFSPLIALGVPVINAGFDLSVSGSFFPAAQSSQLIITWTDTTSGSVVQSEVQWGQVPNGGPVPPGSPPSSVQDMMITRHGPFDNANTFTAKPLLPNTPYAFRVRDYDVAGFIATDWSAWAVITTAPTDQVQLLLDDGSNTVVGYARLLIDGTFLGTAVVPVTEPPGTYALWAVLAGQRMASATLTVVPEGQALPALLQVINPLTSAPFPGSAIVEGGMEVQVSGSNFLPGTAELFLDSIGGMALGSNGPYVGPLFTFPFTWPLGVTGPHNIVAQMGSRQASAPVYAENPPS